MITRYIEVHKRKHIVKRRELLDKIRNIVPVYYIKLEFESEDSVKLPEVEGDGLAFALNRPLTEEEQAASGLVKTLDDGCFTSLRQLKRKQLTNKVRSFFRS